MAVALATSDDLTRFGYTAPDNADGFLTRASARVRLAAGHQAITTDTSTVTFPRADLGCLILWQVPVTGIHAVTRDDGSNIDGWTLDGNELWLPLGWRISPLSTAVTVTYSHGFATLPDELIELVCSVAMRLSGTKSDRDMAIQAQAVGDVSQTINPAALQFNAGLLPSEEATIRRIFYKRG